jgi:hypothetical protein
VDVVLPTLRRPLVDAVSAAGLRAQAMRAPTRDEKCALCTHRVSLVEWVVVPYLGTSAAFEYARRLCAAHVGLEALAAARTWGSAKVHRLPRRRRDTTTRAVT